MLPTLFNYEGRQLRMVTIENEPWFVAKDVCELLEINDTWNAVNRLSPAMKGTHTISTLGGNQEAMVISEPGVYKLVFTSRKPEAERFTDWLASEVIPQIRKTGVYVAPSVDSSMLFQIAKAMEEKEQRIAMLTPKAEYFDALVDRNLLTNFRDTAKELHIKESEFIAFLLEESYIYRDQSKKLKPYAKYVPSLFEIKEQTRDKWAGNQTLITPRGRETFRLLLGKEKEHNSNKESELRKR